MTTYKDAGVDIAAGNSASKKAYAHAMSTFGSRKGMMGAPVEEAGGFAGLLDMGDFFLVQNDDGTGSKMELACALGKYDTLGQDLLAMVVDDAICTGAEVISVSNTLDVPKVDAEVVDQLMGGLAKACQEQQIVVPGGEIAEVPGATISPVWNATSVGIVAKDSVIDTAAITDGDAIIALQSGVARSNGFSLIRKILSDKFGDDWVNTEWKNGVSWGEIMLTPSVIYHGALLTLLGRYGEERTVNIKGLTHVTGGGIVENLDRTLRKSGCGAELPDLWEPHEAMLDLIDIGLVDTMEAYNTWNMGNGMLVIVSANDASQTLELLESAGINGRLAGVVNKSGTIRISAYGNDEVGDK